MSSIVNWGKDFLRSDALKKPSLFWRLKHGFIFNVLNRLIGISIPFVRRNRFQVVELRTSYLKGVISLHGNKNHIGTMYAGAMFLLAEVPGGIVSLFEYGSGYFPILKELTIRYLLPATSDLTIEVSLTQAELDAIRQTADEKGKSDFTLTLDLKDVNGMVVAQSVALY
ncbi:MAG: YiiD C-terminal domain-containing protein [Candidatus Saccharibacteria bacterium]|nr:YiiD C-terminal domain-containing protein [Moraxellaceae bacterium]